MQHQKTTNEKFKPINYYYFIPDYYSLLASLTVVSEKQECNHHIIITSKPIRSFLKYLQTHSNLKFYIIFRDLDDAGLYKRRWTTIPNNLIKSRRFYKKYIRDIDNSIIYFFAISNCLILFSWIKKLAKNNKIIFYHNPYLKFYTDSETSGHHVLKFIIKLMFGIEVYMVRYNHHLFPFLSQKFFDDNNITINYDFRISDDIMKIESIPNTDVLILVDNYVFDGLAVKKTFIEDMNKLLGIIKKHGFSFSLKTHPCNPTLFGDMENERSSVLKHIIPAEYYLHAKKWKYLVGIQTTVLLNAQRTDTENIISILDCIQWKRNSSKMFFKNWLMKHNQKILFPQNWNEFETLLEK